MFLGMVLEILLIMYIRIDIYKEVMLTRGKIELNVNLGLLLEHIFIYIIKGGK